MAKVGILSSYGNLIKETNYGSLFQYFALQEYLKKRNHNPYWIRYCGQKTYFKYIVDRIRLILSFLIKFDDIDRLRTKKEFAQFMRKYIKVSNFIYTKGKLLKYFPPKADFYVVGSDKVWSSDKILYLSFVSVDKKKYSYAASSPAKYKKFGPAEASFLKDFNKVSVRENESIEMCHDAGRFDAIQVVDPTLLFPRSFYENLFNSINDSYDPFVFCYLGAIGESTPSFPSTILSFAKTNSLKTVVVPIEKRGIEGMFPRDCIQRPSPVKWLQLIKTSKYVVTDTFHGTLFSVIMEKPFLSIIPSDKPSIPIKSFLTSIGLESRIVNAENCDIEKMMIEPINWKDVNTKKTFLKNRSEKFLNSFTP